MTFLIFIIVLAIAVFIVLYRNNSNSNNVYRFINKKIGVIYDKYAPYSFKVVREKVKELGQEYTPRQYAIQIVVFAVSSAVITYLYFYIALLAYLQQFFQYLLSFLLPSQQ